MNEQTNEQVKHERTKSSTNERSQERTDEVKHERTKSSTNGRTHERTNLRTNDRRQEWMPGIKSRWKTSNWKQTCIINIQFRFHTFYSEANLKTNLNSFKRREECFCQYISVSIDILTIKANNLKKKKEHSVDTICISVKIPTAAVSLTKAV